MISDRRVGEHEWVRYTIAACIPAAIAFVSAYTEMRVADAELSAPR